MENWPVLCRVAVAAAIAVILASQPEAAVAQRSPGEFSASQSSSSNISAPRRAEQLVPDRAPLVEIKQLDLDKAERNRLRAALEAGDWRRAEFFLVEAAKGRPESAELFKALGAVSFQNRRYLEAAIAYKKANRITPLDERSRFTLATAYIALERGHWARPELEKLAAEHSRNALYPHWLAGVYYSYNWFDEAVAELGKALALEPDFAAARDRLGLCFEGLGKTDEALEEYERAIRLNDSGGSPSPWPAYHLGSLLHDLGQLEEAEKVLRDALEADSGLAEAHYELGLILHKQRNSSQAVKVLLRAAELDASNPKPHYALSQVYRRLGDKEKALEEIRKFRELTR